MVSAVDLKSFQQVKHCLKTLVRSNCILRMADGRLVPSAGVWNGEVSVGNVSHNGTFEVFDSNGAWSVLFEKPLLKKFKAVHNYDSDIVKIPNSSGNWIELQNQYQQEGDHYVFPSRQVSQTSNNESDNSTDIAHLEHKENINQPSQVPNHKIPSAVLAEEEQNIDTEELQIQQALTQQGNPRRSKEEQIKWRTDNKNKPKKSQGERTIAKHNRLARISSKRVISNPSPYSSSSPDTTVTNNDTLSTDLEPEQGNNVWNIDTTSTNDNIGAEQKLLTNNLDKGVFTCHSDPFKTEHVDAILSELTIGDNLTEEQHISIVNLLCEFADCFALSMSEVTAVPGATHKLNIPNGTTFKNKVNQRPLSPLQREYFNGVLDKMLDAGIIAPIDHRDVKACGATTLAKKAHEGRGLNIEELQHRVNNECIAAGIESGFVNLPPWNHKQKNTLETETQTKWRVCQDFAEINKVTKVPPMPQGDIHAKQQQLSGHRWINTFDFAAEFYACEISPEDQPYVCFYVEGQGYFCYKRMPFGLTGAPSTFAEMTAQALGDLIGILFELFVDDGEMAGDDFTETLTNIRTLLMRVREKRLSLSAAKSHFFMTEAIFE
jgi:hypothetical protein